MKLIRTKGRGARKAEEALAALEKRGGAALDGVLPAVQRIVTDVRKQGDRALLRYATRLDGLAGREALRVTPEEMAEASGRQHLTYCVVDHTRTAWSGVICC